MSHQWGETHREGHETQRGPRLSAPVGGRPPPFGRRAPGLATLSGRVVAYHWKISRRALARARESTSSLPASSSTTTLYFPLNQGTISLT